LNVTLPVGVPAPGVVTETVAVNVADWPKTDGLTEGTNAVVVAACPTDSDTLIDPELAKFASPP
jgi:hypothetical protein